MSIREKLKKKIQPTQEPDIQAPSWAYNGSETTTKLYNASQGEFKRIEALILTGEASGPKSRRLVRAVIASLAGFDRSLLNPRRQFELCDWIDQKNQELESLYSLHKTHKRKANQKSKRDLQQEITNLRKKEATHIESDHRALIEAFFDSNMLDDGDVLRQENRRLRNENRELSDTVARLQQLSRETNLKIAQIWEILEPAQRLKLGWRPEKT